MKMKTNKYISAIAIGIILPAMVVASPINVDAAKTGFKDVPKTNQYYLAITEMTKQGIISGYEDGTFRPNEAITRKHAAALVSRAKGDLLPQTIKFVKFKDVSEKNATFGDIKKLQQAGIFAPDAKGNFNPNKPVTRAEMAKILTIAFGLEVKAKYDFPDVPASHPENKYVRALYSNGITKGDNGKFLPDDSVTRGHYSAFMYRVMNLDTSYTPRTVEPVKPIPAPEPKSDPKSGSLVTDNYNGFLDVPLPKGETYVSIKNKQEKEYNSIRVKEVHNYTGTFSTFYNKDENMLTNSKKIGITQVDLERIVNNAVKSGNVHNGGNFSLYYSFDKGHVVISGRN